VHAADAPQISPRRTRSTPRVCPYDGLDAPGVIPASSVVSDEGKGSGCEKIRSLIFKKNSSAEWLRLLMLMFGLVVVVCQICEILCV
jgi:hypothetical protein